MFGLSSYYSFFYLSLYCCTLLIICSVSSFYVFWLFMEFLMLAFMGLMFTLVSSSFVELMVFFLVQTITSLSIFVSYTNELNILMSFCILAKLSMFPFMSWFAFSASKLPNSLLFISSTLHKIPPFLLMSQFMHLFPLSFLFISISLTCWLAAIFMCVSSDLRSLLIFSSMANTSWMLLSLFSSFSTFALYFLFYSFFTFLVLYSFNNTSKISNTISVVYFIGLLIIISGFPPSPIFFMKAYLISSSLSWLSFFSFSLVSLSLASVLLVFSYFRFSFMLVANSYKSHMFI